MGGGELEVLTTPDGERRELDHFWPEILPGGQAVLFTISTPGGMQNWQIAVLSLESGDYDVLVPGGSNPRYVPTGHIVYGVGGNTLRQASHLRLECRLNAFCWTLRSHDAVYP